MEECGKYGKGKVGYALDNRVMVVVGSKSGKLGRHLAGSVTNPHVENLDFLTGSDILRAESGKHEKEGDDDALELS